MSAALSRGSEPLWQEVLRRAAITLGGRGVGVWEADPCGRLRLVAASSDDVAPLADELEAALREMGELPGTRPLPRRWVASCPNRLPPARSGAAESGWPSSWRACASGCSATRCARRRAHATWRAWRIS